MRGIVLLFAAAAAGLAEPAPWGTIVNIGGHQVHLRCEGAGPVLVLLVPGTPRFSFHFALVMPKVATFARVCAYDRAGDAWSEPIAGQPTARIFADELDRVVNHLSRDRPVVLAGHSVGGVLARAYFAEHPDRVAAMVLIDTAPLDTPQVPAGDKRVPLAEATDEQLRAAVEELKRKPRPVHPKAKLLAPFDRLPASLQEAHLWATDKWQAYADAVDGFVAAKYQADLYRLAARARTQTAVPVWFLSRAQSAHGQNPWVDSQAKMAAAWARGKFVRVWPSGHDIQLDQPDAVAAAIGEAVKAASAASHN